MVSLIALYVNIKVSSPKADMCFSQERMFSQPNKGKRIVGGNGRVDAMNFKNPYLWMFKRTTKTRRVWG